MTPLVSTDPSDIANAARCFLSCGTDQQALKTYLLTNVAGIATPPCITPTAPFVFTPLANGDTSLGINWKPLTNTGSLITGYIVYWGTTSGGPYTNNSGVISVANRPYIVTGLSSGTTYYFVVVAQTAIAGCVSANSNQVSGTTSGTPPFDPVVTDWVNRVIANGGARPSNPTITAVDTFYKGLKTDGLDTLMISVNVMAPDSLIACLTPLVKVAGNDPYTNVGFAAGNLSVNGLDDAASHFYLRTGVNPATCYSTNNDAGYTVYSKAVGSNTSVRLIAFDLATIAGIHANNFGTTAAWNLTWVSSSANNVYCFTSCSRTGAAAGAAYEANSIIGFLTQASGPGAPGARPNLDLWAFQWDQNGAPTNGVNVTNAIYSFIAIHHGLTAVQTQAFFNRVQTLRTAFGGGFS